MDERESTRMTDEYRDFLLKNLESDSDNGTITRETVGKIAKRVRLNGKRMRSNTGAHAYISRKLKFPAYYGNNLDALYDMLSTMGEPLTIIIKNSEKLKENLGDYGQAMLNTFSDAARSNSNIVVMGIE